VTRILSALVLIPVVLGTIWFAPHWVFLLLVEIVVGACVVEYVGLMEKSGVPVPTVASGAAAIVACAAIGWPGVPVDLMLIAVLLAATASVLAGWQPAPHVPATAAATLFPVLYIGLPLGTMVALREAFGREALLLVLLTVWVSDTAQFYTGTLFGKRRLSPTISPKKSVEGAIGGLVAGMAIMFLLGRVWLPQLPPVWLVAVGAILVAFGIAGDLFESLLKRSANVKDSSDLIPGHGGVLDRIDALLFVAPGFYLFLRLLS